MAEGASNITESLMGISRMMSQQVQQSEEAMQTLGKGRVQSWSVEQLLAILSTQPGKGFAVRSGL